MSSGKACRKGLVYPTSTTSGGGTQVLFLPRRRRAHALADMHLGNRGHTPIPTMILPRPGSEDSVWDLERKSRDREIARIPITCYLDLALAATSHQAQPPIDTTTSGINHPDWLEPYLRVTPSACIACHHYRDGSHSYTEDTRSPCESKSA